MNSRRVQNRFANKLANKNFSPRPHASVDNVPSPSPIRISHSRQYVAKRFPCRAIELYWRGKNESAPLVEWATKNGAQKTSI